MDAELDLVTKSKQFYAILRENSIFKNDPIAEWKYIRTIEDDGLCICSQKIKYKNIIQNIHTGAELIVGSDCIQRWMNNALLCRSCNCVLGNQVKRLLDQNFICPTCTREKKKRLRILGGNLIHGKRFDIIIKDVVLVEKLLNTDTTTMYPFLREIYKRFEEYANMIYDIDEVEVS